MNFQASMPSSLDSKHRELRKEYLEEYFSEIRSVFAGRNTPIRPFIEDKNGKASAERLEALVNDIVDVHYRNKWDKMIGESESGVHDWEISDKTYNALQSECGLYHSFFLFALQGIIQAERDFTAVKTFADVLKLITITPAHCDVTDEISLIWSDFKDLTPGWGFIEANRFGCSMIIKNHISSLYTPELKDICKTHYAKSTISAKVDDPDELFEYSVKCLYIPKETPEWIASLADPDKFVSSYIGFREKYVAFVKQGGTIYAFYDTVRELIDDHLDQKGFSVFSSVEGTAVAFDRLERFINATESRRIRQWKK